MSYSASEVPRLLACPGSARLPRAEYQTSFAEEGTERHASVEDVVKSIPDGASLPADLPESLAMIAPFVQAGDLLAAESGFAYDVATDTARELGHVARRYAGLGPYERPGTIDLLIRGNGRIIVVDFKGYEPVPRADENTQLATYALMVARAYGYAEVTVVIIYLAEGAAHRKPDVAVLAAMDLDAHAARLKDLEFTTSRRDAVIIAGKHCKYCPSFLFCPAQSALRLEASSEALTMRIEGAIPFEDDAEAALGFDLLERIGLMQKRLRAALYARAAERAIPLADGRVLGYHEKLGKTELDADVAYNVVRDLHGQHIADAAVTREASQAGIKRALELVAAKGAVTATAKTVMAEIEKRGGSKREAKQVLEVFEARPMLMAANE